MKAYTLIEILLIVALVTLLASASSYYGYNYYMASELDASVETLKAVLAEARFKARAVEGGSSWGVRIEPPRLTLFKGSNFATRDPAFDKVYGINGSLQVEGPTEIVFSKFTAEPSAIETIIFKTLTNVSGKVDLQKEGVFY